MAVEGMQRLNTASSFEGSGIPGSIKVNYRTGAKFEGNVVDHKRIGHGTFVWPNGSKYEGDFSENLRHGKGTQVWSDGSSYTGDFVHDLRHGEGSIQWSNGETYEGTFFKDRRHGIGVYKWPDGSSYTGTFYMDKKEGYGTFNFATGDMFQGLYKEDEREGPGVVTYKDGTQDVGMWHGEKIIKLCTEIDKAFTITDHPEFEYKAEEHRAYITVEDENHTLAPIENVIYPPAALDYHPKLDLSEKLNELYSEALDPRSLAVDRKTFNEEFFKSMPKKQVMSSQVVAWNMTPSIVALQKHTLKHDAGKLRIDVDVDAILKLDRSKFKDKGPLERQSEELLVAAGSGDAAMVESLLNSGKVHPDVSDRHGRTALIGATVNWHIEVINILLNQGADVNKLSDEGCSALSAGTIFYYPVEGFLYNMAERYMVKPPELECADSKQDGMPKGILANNKERRASRLNQINKIRSESISTSTSLPLASKNSKFRPGGKDQVKILTTHPSGTLVEHSELREDDDGKITLTRYGDGDSAYGGDFENRFANGDEPDEEGPEEFESNQSMRNYHIEVSEQLVERCATQLSHNTLVVSREASEVGDSKARRLAVQMSHHERMKQTLDLLLRRGADPNSSSVPMPVIFFAIKSADVEMVQQLLMKGADTNTKLSAEKGGLYPIHIACAIPGEEGVHITELLLNALADPDARALEDDSFLNHTLEEEWSKDVISAESKAFLGGRTALQIACARDDNYKHACKVVRLLLEHKADASLMCNGFSPLALAITSGNDLAVDELLLFGADPSLTLTHGVGSALCVATSTEYEHRRTIQGRMQLVDKLIRAGANVLAPIQIGAKRVTGTAVDYAYYMFNQDRRIAHMPYHALTHAERETYNARRKLLAHIGDIMRNKAVEREKRKNFNDEKEGVRSQSPSANFVYIGAGAKLPPGVKSKAGAKAGQGQVKFESPGNEEEELKMAMEPARAPSPTRKPMFKYCYECGRSVGVRLAACTRCKEVYYCSKTCKLKAWNARHREECIRIGGRSRSPSPKHRASSPTAATVADRGKRTAVKIHDTDRSNARPSSKSSQPSLSGAQRRQSSAASDKKKKGDGTSNMPQGNESHRSSNSRDSKPPKGHSGSYSEKNSRTGSGKTKRSVDERSLPLTRKYKRNGVLEAVPKGRNIPNVVVVRGKATLKIYPVPTRPHRLPPLQHATKKWLVDAVPVKGLSKSAHGDRTLGKHRFRTGSPPNYQYVYVDNYSHN